MQFLYKHDVDPVIPEFRKQAWKSFWAMQEFNAQAKKFAEELINGVLDHQEAVDAKIKAYSKNWDFHRIAVVDRCILRLALYELLFRDDIPPVVSINEAIELAKKFSG